MTDLEFQWTVLVNRNIMAFNDCNLFLVPVRKILFSPSLSHSVHTDPLPHIMCLLFLSLCLSFLLCLCLPLPPSLLPPSLPPFLPPSLPPSLSLSPLQIKREFPVNVSHNHVGTIGEVSGRMQLNGDPTYLQSQVCTMYMYLHCLDH